MTHPHKTNTTEIIFHLTTHDAWETTTQHKELTHPSLAAEGFIHASTRAQLCATANRYYAGTHELLAIAIDAHAIAEILKFEAPSPPSPETAGLRFPHIYGPVPQDAILGAYPMVVRDDGSFALPDGLP